MKLFKFLVGLVLRIVIVFSLIGLIGFAVWGILTLILK